MATQLKTGSLELRRVVNDQLVDINTYDESSETVAAPSALSLTVRTSLLAITGTDAHTLAAPTFKRQYKNIQAISGASTPVSTVTVTGMRVAGQNVFAGFGDVADDAPKSLTLYSPDGASWDIVSMVGLTVS